MRNTNKKWISAGTSMMLGMQKFQAIGEVIELFAKATEIDHNLELRKRMKEFKTLANDIDVEVTWIDPKTKKEWTTLTTREELIEWANRKK